MPLLAAGIVTYTVTAVSASLEEGRILRRNKLAIQNFHNIRLNALTCINNIHVQCAVNCNEVVVVVIPCLPGLYLLY